MHRLRIPVILFALVAMLGLGATSLLAGCGSQSASSADETSTATTSAIPKVQATPAPELPPDKTVPDEQASPYGPGSTSSQTVGALVDGLQLKDIRWSDHGSYYRIVFDMATTDGQPVLQAPHAAASMSPDHKQVQVILGGIRSISDSPNVTSDQLQIGDTVVTSIVRQKAPDDQALVYAINLSRPSTYALAGVGSPGRIVIDVMK